MTRRHVFLGALAVTVLLTACSGSSAESPTSSVLPTRNVESGSVEVTITPTRFDATGATFAITLDTHSVDLSVDLAASAALDVDGTAWTVAGWTGTGPGGHHREGELAFTAPGPPSGTATLRISGLPEPVEATWDIGGT